MAGCVGCCASCPAGPTPRSSLQPSSPNCSAPSSLFVPPPACRYDTRKDIKFAKDAPVIGLVLQRSHLVTGDHGHYDGVVSELESRGAKVVPVFAGAWR